MKTFSIGFDEKDFSEVTYARQVGASLRDRSHHKEVLRPRAAELLPKLVHAYGEAVRGSIGAADLSCFPR